MTKARQALMDDAARWAWSKLTAGERAGLELLLGEADGLICADCDLASAYEPATGRYWHLDADATCFLGQVPRRDRIASDQDEASDWHCPACETLNMGAALPATCSGCDA